MVSMTDLKTCMYSYTYNLRSFRSKINIQFWCEVKDDKASCGSCLFAKLNNVCTLKVRTEKSGLYIPEQVYIMLCWWGI